MKQGKRWLLRDHEGQTGRREVRQHYERASDELKAAFDVHWEFLEVRPRDQWTRPEAAKLRPEKKGGFREYFEFRFFCERVEQRPIGFFGISEKHFTLLKWAIEKGNKFVPPKTIEICDHRRKSLLDGTAKSVGWDKEECDENDKVEQDSTQVLQRRIR
jgi:hypothetical protein